MALGLAQGHVALASGLGYASIVFWLCAQLPQVLKNWSRRSCEGLALPFLVNWLFGDITNLLGCILTDQLPFQTYLAGYFCLIDFALLVQFFYYRRLAPPPPPPSLVHRQQSFTYYTTSPKTSLILPASSSGMPPRHRSTSHPSIPSSMMPPPAKRHQRASTHSHTHPEIHIYPSSSPSLSVAQDGTTPISAIREAALDVARQAERVSHRRSQSRRRLSRQNTSSTILEEGGPPPSSPEREHNPMLDSFHSEMSAASGSTADYQRMSQSTSAMLDRRGRTLQRGAVRGVDEEEDEIAGLPSEGERDGMDGRQEMTEVVRGGSRTRSKSRGPSMVRGSGGRGKGRRAAGVAFMSLGLLVGWTRPTRRDLFSESGPFGWQGPPGVVLSGGSVVDANWAFRPAIRHPQPFGHILPAGTTLDPTETIVPLMLDHDHDHPHLPLPDEPPSYQRIIGRISAWACTTLYLTSRLPQIWKNFERKSIEGLSILLFIFAFAGNLSYVLSIVLNPSGTADPSEAGQYLLEALPYLLGSGGTLVFDLTIVLQSLIYGSAPPLLPPPSPVITSTSRRRFLSRRRHRQLEDGHAVPASTERQPLLSSSMHGWDARDRSLSPHATVGGSARVHRESGAVGHGGARGGSPTAPGRTRGDGRSLDS